MPGLCWGGKNIGGDEMTPEEEMRLRDMEKRMEMLESEQDKWIL